MNYHIDQINKLAEPGVFGCAIQIRNNDNGNATTWMNITDEQLAKIRDIFANDEPELVIGDWVHIYTDPVTCNDYEDIAKLIKCVKPESGDGLSTWIVEFDDHELVTRIVNKRYA